MEEGLSGKLLAIGFPAMMRLLANYFDILLKIASCPFIVLFQKYRFLYLEGLSLYLVLFFDVFSLWFGAVD